MLIRHDCQIQGFEVSYWLSREGENLLAGEIIWHEWGDVWMFENLRTDMQTFYH